MVGGRTVEVDLALSQDDARNLASGGRALSGPGKDNRNLYLVPSSSIPHLQFCQRSPAAGCLWGDWLAHASRVLSLLP